MLQAKNIDKSHDFEGAFACCVRSEQSAAHHDGIHVRMRDTEKHAYIAAVRSVYWLVTEEMPNRKHASLLNLQRLHGCRDVAALRRGGNSTKESHWSFNQLLSALELQSAAVSIEQGNYVRLLEHCHKNVKLYNSK